MKNGTYQLKLVDRETFQEVDSIPCGMNSHKLENLVISQYGGTVYDSYIDNFSVEWCAEDAGIEIRGNPGYFQVKDLETGNFFGRANIVELERNLYPEDELLNYEDIENYTLFLRQDGTLYVSYRMLDGSYEPMLEVEPRARFKVEWPRKFSFPEWETEGAYNKILIDRVYEYLKWLPSSVISLEEAVNESMNSNWVYLMGLEEIEYGDYHPIGKHLVYATCGPYRREETLFLVHKFIDGITKSNVSLEEYEEEEPDVLVWRDMGLRVKPEDVDEIADQWNAAIDEWESKHE